MEDDLPRSREARRAAERALVRVVHHYGATPEFVLLGGLVPDLLCSQSDRIHAGTTDVDVQVDLEVEAGAVNTARLEQALRNAEFEVTPDRIWRWWTVKGDRPVVIKFEVLADLPDQPVGATVRFDACDELGAVNLRGTRFAAQEVTTREISTRIGGTTHTVSLNVAGLAGFLLAKAAAARSRRKPKDWYDIAFVLLHNDLGGPIEAAARVRQCFGAQLLGEVRNALDDLQAKFATVDAQGPHAFAGQMVLDHPDEDLAQLRADAVTAVQAFHADLFPQGRGIDG